MQLALTKAPYRVFTKSADSAENSPLSLLLYCLPVSVTEYLAASQEAARRSVRFVLLNESDTTVFACSVNDSVGAVVLALIVI
jgi:hypothetical protein